MSPTLASTLWRRLSRRGATIQATSRLIKAIPVSHFFAFFREVVCIFARQALIKLYLEVVPLYSSSTATVGVLESLEYALLYSRSSQCTRTPLYCVVQICSRFRLEARAGELCKLR